MQGRSPLRRDIALELEIHVGPRNSRITGDLDIFVTGVCDGLMAADPRAVRTEIWGADAGGPICLSIAIVIEDDCEFMAITARKVVGDTVAPWYLVRLAGD